MIRQRRLATCLPAGPPRPHTRQHGTGAARWGHQAGRFLRARIPSVEAGPTVDPGLHRTPGLRREELATLAGIGIDHYTRLEQGRETRPSTSVIDAPARARSWRRTNTTTCAVWPFSSRALRRSVRRRPAGPSGRV